MREITAGYSRIKARKIIKDLYPDLPTDEHVHHIDGNPFNNNINNLCMIKNSDHIKIHWLRGDMRVNGCKRTTLNQDLEILEKWLVAYNTFCAK